MDAGNGGRKGKGQAEELILRTIAAHADSLLRTARRHSLCADDAQDAYQRGLEIFMRHAERLDPARAPAWLHTVVKREAKSIRRSRQKLVGSSDVNFDAHEAAHVPTPDEQLLSFDMVNRSAEALQRLKPQELRALWLKAQGHSYSDIGAITGWSYTKVNRCLTEGRRSFLERYAGIEAGDECARWLPVLSAMVDGEATEAQINDIRPHLRNCAGCRGRLKALRDSSEPLAAVMPVPLAVMATGPGEDVSHVMMRAYEAFAAGFHERAVHGVTKAQAAIEAASAGKVAAVAASAAAVAGGGYASVEHSTPIAPQITRTAKAPPPSPDGLPKRILAIGGGRFEPRPTPVVAERPKTEFQSFTQRRKAAGSPEFASSGSNAPSRSKSLRAGSMRSRELKAAPEFSPSTATTNGNEFGP